MPPSPAHTARVRAEIFGHAGRLFRLRGYAGTNIDDIMLAADLTRGAFYAHFKSKDELFALVVGSGQGLLWKMRAKDAKVLDVLDAYLAKDDLVANAQDMHDRGAGRATSPARPARPARLCQRPCTPWSASWRAGRKRKHRSRCHGGRHPGDRRG